MTTSDAVLQSVFARPGHFSRKSLTDFLAEAGVARAAKDPRHAIRCEISRHLALGTITALGPEPKSSQVLHPSENS